MDKFAAGLKRGMSRFSRPVRITHDIRPGNPVQGLEGLTGAAEQSIFGRPLSQFATRPRQALQAMSRVRGRK